jgi:hypothetical protein
VLVLGLLTAACGGDGDAENAPVGQGCEPTSEDLFAEALAFERALVIQGRADAAFDQAFGDESEALLDEADAQRTELIEEVAAELGLELPDPVAMSQCPAKTGVAREPLSVNVQLAFGVTARALVEAAKRAPINGAEPSMPATTTTTGLAEDGTERTTATTFNIVTSGHDSTVVVTTTMRTEVTTGAGGTVESASVIGSIDVCPDPGGISAGDIVVVLDGSAGSATYHANTNQHFNYVVNDDAFAILTQYSSVLEYTATGGARETSVRAHAEATSSETGDISVGDFVFDFTDGTVESRTLVERNLLTFAHGTAELVRKEAQAKWRNGTCLQVDADPASGMVDAGAQIDVTATVKHKFDMSNVDAPVVATMSGVQSLDKQGQRVPAPATYHYVAGGEFRDEGIIKLKSTSRRGIGEGEARFVVKCDENMPCPEGKTLNLDTCMCECTEVMTCPDGQMWDPESCMCVCAEETCSGGQRWDTELCECVCDDDCPPGQMLNVQTCTCEQSCDIDPMIGNADPEACKWVGSIDVTMADSGTVESSTRTERRIQTWTASYDASFTVEDQGASIGQVFLNGSIGGSWEFKDETTFLELGSCTLTSTESATVSTQTNGNGDALGYIFSNGDGTFSLSVAIQPNLELYGTTTVVDTCADDDPYSDVLAMTVAGYMGTGSASRDAFTGSSDTEYPSFESAPGHFSTFHVAWNLHLVRR